MLIPLSQLNAEHLVSQTRTNVQKHGQKMVITLSSHMKSSSPGSSSYMLVMFLTFLTIFILY